MAMAGRELQDALKTVSRLPAAAQIAQDIAFDVQRLSKVGLHRQRRIGR